MKDKDKYLALEVLLTFSLLFLVISLLGKIISAYRLYLIGGLVCGFCFSWFNRGRTNTLIRSLLTVGTSGIFFWIIYSVKNSSLLYREVILILIKNVLILEIILSFNALPPILSYIQALSVPLFMAHPLFVKGYDGFSSLLILGYLACCLAILKVKFYGILKPVKEKVFRRSVLLLTVFFIISLSVSWMLFSHLVLGSFRKGGILPELGREREWEILEKEYYDLQDKILDKITGLIGLFKSTQDRQNILLLLNYLIKDSPYVMEVDKAEQGLISFLKTPGPGLEKADTEGTAFLINSYVDKKISVVLQRIREKIMDNLKRYPLRIKDRLFSLISLHRIQYSRSYGQIKRYEKALQRIIDDSFADINVKKELKEDIKKLKEWKIFEIYRQKLSPLKERAEFQEFLDSQEKIEEKVESLSEIKEFRKTEISPLDKVKKEPVERTLPKRRIIVTKNWLVQMIFKGLSFFLLSVIIIFLILYILTEMRKNKLLSLYRDPREFIIGLYENIKRILSFFGLKYDGFTPPFSYAKLAEKRYSVKDNVFLKFTIKFAEAKYSQRILHLDDSALVLKDYNNFLKILVSNYNKFNLFLRYCLTLLYRIPFFL